MNIKIEMNNEILTNCYNVWIQCLMATPWLMWCVDMHVCAVTFPEYIENGKKSSDTQNCKN